MKSALLLGTFLLLASVAVPPEAEPLLLAGEVEIDLPPGWVWDGSPEEYPFQFIHSDLPADLLIHKAILEREETISDGAELRLAVDHMVQNVILGLPGGELVTNNGLYHNDRTEFILDFISLDTTTQQQLRHRLVGIIYRHTDGYQLLYTVWGKADETYWGDVADDIRVVQESFAYAGPVTSDVFAEPGPSAWWYGLMLLLLVVLVFLLRKRRGAGDRAILSPERNFWRCSCGRLNHVRKESCRRCGRPNRSPITATS